MKLSTFVFNPPCSLSSFNGAELPSVCRLSRPQVVKGPRHGLICPRRQSAARPSSAPIMTATIELSPETKSTVKSTVPVLRKEGVAIVTRFYELLFSRHPELRNQFNMDRHAKGKTKTDGIPAQVAALSGAVMAYASNIDKLEVIMPTVERIAHKHVSRAVIAPQYDSIGECLLMAIKEVLGDAATDEIMEAWTAAYGFLANAFITLEKEITEKMTLRAGYSGFMPMTITHSSDLPDGDKAIWLVPKDIPVPVHDAGQFVAIALRDTGVVEDTMTTVYIDEVSSSELRMRVPKNEEAATKYIFENSDVGKRLLVGVPCGKAKD